MLPPEDPSNRQISDEGDNAPRHDAAATPLSSRLPLTWSDGEGGSAQGPTCSISLNSLPSLLREDLEDAPFWKEVVAFANMPGSALDPYYGKFVAIYRGDIVDSDRDEGALALRFYRTFGYVPVYIHAVGIEDGVIDIND